MSFFCNLNVRYPEEEIPQRHNKRGNIPRNYFACHFRSTAVQLASATLVDAFRFQKAENIIM